MSKNERRKTMSEQKKVTSNIHIEGAKLLKRNFRGEKTDYNEEGKRNFGVYLDDDLAESLIADGWPVKYLKPRKDDPDQYRQPCLFVKVNFNPYPPIAVLINSKGKKRLDEDTIDQLDWSIITNCDLIIRPYNYPAIKGRPAGVSAYLKAIYVTISEDEFVEKYAGIPDLDEDCENEDCEE